MVPDLAKSTRGDSLFKRESYVQPSTSTSLSYHSYRKIEHISIMCKINEAFANEVYR